MKSRRTVRFSASFEGSRRGSRGKKAEDESGVVSPVPKEGHRAHQYNTAYIHKERAIIPVQYMYRCGIFLVHGYMALVLEVAFQNASAVKVHL